MRLVRMGHQVTVFNRLPFNTYAEDEFCGVRIRRVRTLPGKGTDTLVHSAICTGLAMLEGYDIYYFCGVGSSVFSFAPRLLGGRTVINVDGADWERAKWGPLGKTWLRWSERMATLAADSVVADHPVIKARYERNFGFMCDLISYGADVVDEDPGTSTLERFGLTPEGYLLYVSRLTPENNAHLVMEAYLRSDVPIPLVVVGDAPYVSDYQRRLKELVESSNGRIRMTGYQFGEAYRQLSYHSRAYLFPTSIDATRPVLLEQMGMGACIIARDTPANRHVLGDAALWFRDEDPLPSLAETMKTVAAPGYDPSKITNLARERIRTEYSWDHVADQYEELFTRLKPKR